MSDTPGPHNRRGRRTTPVPVTGPSRSTRSTGQTPVPGMDVDPMSRRRSRSNSLVPNAGNLGRLTNQPTNLSTAYGGSHAVSAGLPVINQTPTAGTTSFEYSFQPGEAATAGRGRGMGRSTPAPSGRGRGSSHLSPIDEASHQSSVVYSPAHGSGRGRHSSSRGAPSVSGRDVPIPSIEDRDAATFRDETAGQITTNQSNRPRDVSPAESVHSNATRSVWGRLKRWSPHVVNASAVFVAIALYAFILAIVVDMMFFARMLPHTYCRHRIGQIGVLFDDSDLGQHLLTNQQDLLKKYNAQHVEIQWFNGNINHVNTAHQKFKTDIEKQINSLKLEMPETLVLPGLDGYGQAMVPESFWTAARAFLTVAGGDSPDGLEFWQHFKATNAARLEAFLSTDDDSLLKKAVQNDILVDKETVIDLIKNRISQLELTLPHIAGSNLTYAIDQIVVANLRETLTTVNFFSRGMGATIIPELTSPTLGSAKRFFDARLQGLKSLWIPSEQDRERVGVNTPGQALQSWQEESDCWCAAKSGTGKGQAQLAVRMLHRVYPTKMVVEHIPRGATLDITTAPQRIELWFSVENKSERNKLEKAVNAMVKARRTSFDTDKPSGAWDRPDSTYVFVGSFDYDITAPNHVQVLEPLVSLANLKIPVEDAIVRVASNHGQRFTCLYRLRMLGELVDRVNVDPEKRFQKPK